MSQFTTPLGVYLAGSSSLGLVFLEPEGQKNSHFNRLNRAGNQMEEGSSCNSQVIEEIGQYFAGIRSQFAVSLDLRGTPFEKKVWAALLPIPYGRTCSYGDIAKVINQPKGARAVGGAVGRNPISIIVPCHRVIGVNGDLVGYGGGIDRKLALLELENKTNHPFHE